MDGVSQARADVSDAEMEREWEFTARRFRRRYKRNVLFERALIVLLGFDGLVIAGALLTTLQNPAFASEALGLEMIDRMRSSEPAFILGGSLAIGQMLFSQLQSSIRKHEQAMGILRLLHAREPHMMEALKINAARRLKKAR